VARNPLHNFLYIMVYQTKPFIPLENKYGSLTGFTGSSFILVYSISWMISTEILVSSTNQGKMLPLLFL